MSTSLQHWHIAALWPRLLALLWTLLLLYSVAAVNACLLHPYPTLPLFHVSYLLYRHVLYTYYSTEFFSVTGAGRSVLADLSWWPLTTSSLMRTQDCSRACSFLSSITMASLLTSLCTQDCSIACSLLSSIAMASLLTRLCYLRHLPPSSTNI